MKKVCLIVLVMFLGFCINNNILKSSSKDAAMQFVKNSKNIKISRKVSKTGVKSGLRKSTNGLLVMPPEMLVKPPVISITDIIFPIISGKPRININRMYNPSLL